MKDNLGRLTRLDGLRGVLSLMVALNHSFLVLTVPAFANVWQQNFLYFHDFQSKINQLFTAIGNGGFAVTIFFVLSGLVMGMSLDKHQQTLRSTGVFLVKRVIRLMAPYVAMITLVGIFMHLGLTYKYYPMASSWYLWWMNFQMTLKEYFLNIALYHIYIGGVTWTLRVILFISLFFPYMFWISKKFTRIQNLIILAFLVFASFAFLSLPGFRDPRYAFMFYAGLIIPQWKNIFEKIPNTLSVKLALLFGFVFSILVRYPTDEYVGGAIETIFAVVLVGILTYNQKLKIFNFLDSKFLQFTGKISYSLYLIHFTVLYGVAKLCFEVFPSFDYTNNYFIVQLCFFLVSVALAYPVSYLVYKYSEKPSISLTNKLNHFE